MVLARLLIETNERVKVKDETGAYGAASWGQWCWGYDRKLEIQHDNGFFVIDVERRERPECFECFILQRNGVLKLIATSASLQTLIETYGV